MSNRIRILFHCDLEGRLARVGPKALSYMTFLVKRFHKEAKASGGFQRPPITSTGPVPKGLEWITVQEWAMRHKPPYKDRMYDSATLGKYYLVKTQDLSKVQVQIEPLQIPAFKNVVERAKWLWAHLPPDYRKHCHLVVTRESRKSLWRHSLSNPRKYRYFLAKDPTKDKNPAAKIPGLASPEASFSGNTSWYTNSLIDYEGVPNVQWPAAHSTTYTMGIIDDSPAPAASEEIAENATVPIPPPIAVEPEQGSFAASVAAIEKAALKGLYGKAVKAAAQSAGHKFVVKKAPPKKKTPVSVAVDDDGNVVQVPTPASEAAEKPVKPKLRIGVWA